MADGMADICVRDTGSGMDAAQVESLFRADRTLPQGSEHGFGLILCRYIIKKHDDLTRRGCRIWAESTLGQGTAMHVMLATK
jgi:signal transduction histidine kinase